MATRLFNIDDVPESNTAENHQAPVSNLGSFEFGVFLTQGMLDLDYLEF